MKKIFILLFISLFLPSCSTYVNWFKCTFTGGQKNDVCLKAADPYICSMPIYNQLQTIGLFDVLWLTKDSVSVFAQLRANKLGFNSEEQESVYQEEFNKIKNKLVFYVLAPKKLRRSLIEHDDYNFPWGLYLNINTENDSLNYRPDLVKKIYDFPSEYKFMLSYNYNKFVILDDNYIKYRQVYKVEFDVDNILNDIKTLVNMKISLNISSVLYKSCCCSWELPIDYDLNNYIN